MRSTTPTIRKRLLRFGVVTSMVLSTCALTAAVIATPAGASSPIIGQLGTPPQRCFFAGSLPSNGCDVYNIPTPDYMDATYYGSIVISQNLVMQGEELDVSAVPNLGGSVSWYDGSGLLGIPGAVAVSGCDGGDSCDVIMPPDIFPPQNDGSFYDGHWEVATAVFCGFFGCAPSSDYYYVSPDPTISGYVTNEAGAPLDSPNISISGATVTSYDANTGYYNAIVDPGTYSVTASVAGQSLTVSQCTGQTQGMACSVALTNQIPSATPHSATASFVLPEDPTISGAVTNADGTPAVGTTIQMNVVNCFNDSSACANTTATTGQNGQYSASVGAGTYTVAPTGLASTTLSDPNSASVTAQVETTQTQDFLLTTGPVVSSVVASAAPWAGGTTVSINGAGFGSANAADTVQFCTASQACTPGVSPSVVGDALITVTTPDMSSNQVSGQPLAMWTNVIVTNTKGQQSSYSTGSKFLFGCQNYPDLATGQYTTGGCFIPPAPGDTQYQTNQVTMLDGAQLVSSGSDQADVNTGAGSYTAQSASMLQLQLPGSQLATLLTGVTNIDLTQGSVTLNAAGGANLAGFPVSGSVTLTSVTQQTMKITATVKLPTILGGASGTITVMTTQGTGVTSMNIVVAAGQPENVAQVFSLTGLTLNWTKSSNTWTVNATGTATSNPFTLNGNLTYGSSGITSGNLSLTGGVVLGGGVITFNSVMFTYATATGWSASASITQATGSLSFAIAVDSKGNITSGSITSNSAITLFGAITLQSFSMTWAGGTWSASATGGATGQNSISVSTVPGAGGIQSFHLTLANITLGSAVQVNSLDVGYTATNNDYSGKISVTLTGSHIGIAGSIDFQNGSFNSASLDFTGLHIPLGQTGVFIVGGSAAISLTPTLSLTGGVNLEFGPEIAGLAAFGASVQLNYTFGTSGNGPNIPWSATMTGAVAAGGVPGMGKAITLGNGQVSISQGGNATICVAAGAAGAGGCSSTTFIPLKYGSIDLHEMVSGQLIGTVSPQGADLYGTVQAKGTWLTGTAVIEINTLGIAGCAAGHGFTWLWGNSSPTSGCPTSGFTAPNITAASSGPGDPTTGLNVDQGGPASVSASGFAPGESVAASLASTDTVVGTAFADGSGDVTVPVTIPVDEALGSDSLTLAGASSGDEVALPLLVSTAAASAPTTVEVLAPTSLAAGGSLTGAGLADGTPAPTYALSDAPSWLSIDPNSGALSGTEPNSGETSFTYSVVATNNSGSVASPTQTVTVVPDATPTSVTVQTVTTMTAGQPYSATASADGTPAGTFTLTDAAAWLTIDPVSGVVSGTEPNNAESSFSYGVTATNASGSATSSTVTVDVTAPAAPTTVTATGPATIIAGSTYAATVVADGGPAPTFSLSDAPSWLSVDPVTGHVTGTEPNSGEPSFSYAVVATNDSGSATSTTTVVDVTPDAAPTTVTVTGPSTLVMASDYDATTTADGTPAAQFSFASSPAAPSWLSIDPATGDVTGIEPGNFESSFGYAVVATNSSGSITSATETVDVLTAPVFTAASPDLSLDPGGAFSYGFVAQSLPDAPTYSLDSAAPSWLTINSTTGAVSGTEPNDGEFSFAFFVTATNSQGATTVGPFTVAVNVAPVFTADTPPLVSTATDVYQYQFQANGGPDGVTYSVESASPWLTIDPETGVVTATTADVPSYTYSIVATDGEGSTTVGPFTVITNSAPLFIADSPPTSVGFSAPYQYDFRAISFPDASTYAFASTPTPPNWLTINATTGDVSGTEPGTGETTFSYAVVATNSQGSTTTATINVSVETIPLLTSDSPPTAVPAGGSYSYQFAATDVGGSTGGPTYYLVSAPGWLSINAATGVVSGTEPNNGEATFSYSIQANNNSGSTVVGPFTVDVDLAPVFTTNSPPTSIGTDYADYDYTFHATATPDPATYALGSGAPSWLSINSSTGEVSGTEPNFGTTPFTYSVIATNSQGSTPTGPFSVYFGPPVVSSVIDLANSSLTGVFPNDQIEITGQGFGDASGVHLTIGSCSGSAGVTLGVLTSSALTINQAGTQILFNVPDFFNAQYNYPYLGKCADSTLPLDITVSGAGYTNTSAHGEALTSTNNEANDEVFFGNPRAFTPTVTSVVDTSTGQPNGPLVGGEGLTITGSFFFGVTGVTFSTAGCTNDPGNVIATVPASDLTVTDNTTITLTSPSDLDDDWNSSCNGEVDTDVQVQVATPPSGVTGESAITEPADVFSFEALSPTVTSVTDTGSGSSDGSIAGGDQITITGTNLFDPTAITFTDAGCTGDAGTVSAQVTSGISGNVDGTSLTFTSPGDIADLSNACPDGGVLTNVQVTDVAPQYENAPESPINEPNDEFEFTPASVTSVTDARTSTNVGTASGGDTITIAGSDLASASEVDFIDSSCTADAGTTTARVASSDFVVNAAGTTITLTSPSEAADTNNQCANGDLTTDVVVIETDGNGNSTASAVTPADEYNFQFPYVGAVTDAVTDNLTGSVIPGDALTITGTGFTGATSVRFVTQGCMPHPGVTLATISASGFIVSGGGTEISLTSPGNLADMSDQCYNLGAYVDVIVSVTNPSTHDVLVSGAQSNDSFQFQPPTAYSEQGPTGNYFLDAVGGQRMFFAGWGFTGVTAVRYTYGGHVLATEPVSNVSWGNLYTVVPNLSALAVDLPHGQSTLAVGIQTETPDAHVSGGVIYSIVYPSNHPFTIAFPTVSSARTTTGALSHGALTGGEHLTIDGSGLGTATAVEFQYRNAAGGTGSVSVPVTSVNSAETSLTVTAPNLGLEVGLSGANDIHLASGATSVLTSVRVVTGNTVSHQTYASPLAAPADQFSFTVPARSHPAITSSAAATAVVGASFSYVVTTSGWPHATISTSTLPRWLKLTRLGNGTATLTGKPTATGTVRVTVTARNGVSPTATLHLVVTVDATPHVTTGFSTSATVGVHYSTTVHATGTPTPVVAVTGLPSWLTATAGSGDLVLSGTPTGTGTWFVTLTATNAVGHVSEVVEIVARAGG